jgi:lipopolysaccharide/colanic/teichoic acid biosynthesis glycosyltransferase
MYSPLELKLKRLIDAAAAAMGLAATAPALLGAAALVRATSPGPALFRQTRVGRGGRPFTMLKLRSMRPGGSGPQVTAGGDARVTPLGRLLRRTKLDELPELLNVLRGDMSLVGPRPEVPRYVERWPAAHRAFVLSVRPGLTDPATVRFRNEEEILARAADPERAYVEEILPAKVAMYRDYLERSSLLTDARVLLDTLLVIAFPSRSRQP